MSTAAVLLLTSACAPRAMNVRAQPMLYSPAMSSAVGIGLTPVFVPPSGTTLHYHWSANFGYFVSWNAPAYQVVPRGPDLVATPGTLYWTYDPALASVDKPPFSITIEAQDAQTERVWARSTLILDWDGDTARVRD